jgi:hypothetical protein
MAADAQPTSAPLLLVSLKQLVSPAQLQRQSSLLLLHQQHLTLLLFRSLQQHGLRFARIWEPC